MTKTITLAFWAGGGVWGQSQLLIADYITRKTGINLNDIIDVHAAGSIGNIAGLATATGKSYQDSMTSFRQCAENMMGGDLRETQLSRSIEHSLHHLNQANPIKRRLFRNREGKIHLRHEELGNFLTETFGTTRLCDLDKNFISFAHHMETNERIAFSHLHHNDYLSPSGWDVIPNHGSNHTLTDVTLASTAAPTVFGPHEINGNHYIDCANIWSPLPVIKNLFRMAHNPEEIKIDILYFGTGIPEKDYWNADNYKNHGLLQMIADWNGATSSALFKHDLRELKADYADRVTFNAIDVPVPAQFNDAPYARDIFNGSAENMTSIETLTRFHLKTFGHYYTRIIETIAEKRERESSVDPLTISRKPSLLSRIIPPFLKAGIITPHQPMSPTPH